VLVGGLAVVDGGDTELILEGEVDGGFGVEEGGGGGGA